MTVSLSINMEDGQYKYVGDYSRVRDVGKALQIRNFKSASLLVVKVSHFCHTPERYFSCSCSCEISSKAFLNK